MFSVNERVIYPGYGVAIIHNIIEKTIAGTVARFYELSFLSRDVTILVPVANADTVGIRALSGEDCLEDVYGVMMLPPREAPHHEFTASSWNRRSKEYQAKLRMGGIRDLAEIYRDLRAAEGYKELSFGEKQLLQQAEELLVQELSVVYTIPEEVMAQKLRDFCKKHVCSVPNESSKQKAQRMALKRGAESTL